MAKGSNSLSKFAVWALLGLLIIALGGFGATNLSGTARTIGSVGDKYIDVDTFARQMQQEMQALTAQLGQPVTMARARELGLDQAVISRLVRARALDYEAAQMGLSVGDEVIRDEILNISAFQGLDGQFDREAYRFALSNSGTTESQFEAQLRDEVSRTLMQGAMMGGVQMPDTFAETLAAYVGERRDVTWARLDQSNLTDPLPTPDNATLRAFYDENIDSFFLPVSKRITYAVLLPEQLLADMDVPEDQLRAAYDARSAEYIRPERRLVERLAFLDEASAEQAAAQLEVNGTTFEALVAERGLAMADVDLGDVDRLSLDAAGEAVFAAEVGDIVGPLPTDLGSALFRVNGVLAAQTTSFEDAREELLDDLARDAARRQVDAQAESFEDMLAGGATLEDLANETDMQIGTIDWWPTNGEGIAAYSDFREAAAALTAEDFPTILSLSDGGIFAMRLDETLPRRPIPFDEALESVTARYEAAETEKRLTAQAEAALPALREGQSFEAQEFESQTDVGLTRTDFVPGTPPEFMTTLFEMESGEVRVLSAFGALAILRLDAVQDAAEDAELQAQAAQLTEQAGQALAADMFEVFSTDVLLRAGPQINQQIVDAVLASFP
ncbi:MAG: SurA N-terminal domain-containing protein [Pseudomonadota bacterium]